MLEELRSNLRAALEPREAPPTALLPDVITCPACRRGEPCADNEKLIAGKRKLAVTVRPDSRVVFFLRVGDAPPSAAWEISADDWLVLSKRIARAIAKPAQYGGAVLEVGNERPPIEPAEVSSSSEVTPESLQALVSGLGMVEQQ